MLYIVLLLVVAALAGVVAALITANSLWAWISIGLSVLAGVVLLVDWLRRRSKGTKPEAAEQEKEGAGAEPARDQAEEPATDEEGVEPERTTVLATSGELPTEQEEGGGEPGEEETDAADLLTVSELETEVLVVDEHPRYHLTDCGWLHDRETIPIAVSEARELGFTPCARCGPDAKLAADHRDSGTKSRAEG